MFLIKEKKQIEKIFQEENEGTFLLDLEIEAFFLLSLCLAYKFFFLFFIEIYRQLLKKGGKYSIDCFRRIEFIVQI